MRDKVNKNMLSTRQMPQQAPSQQPPQAPPQGPPKVPPPVQHPPLIPQGPYPDLPPYFPYPLVAIQNRPSSFNNRRGGRPNNNKSKSGPNRNNKCLQCGGYGHWAKLCHSKPKQMQQLSHPQDLRTPHYVYLWILIWPHSMALLLQRLHSYQNQANTNGLTNGN